MPRICSSSPVSMGWIIWPKGVDSTSVGRPARGEGGGRHAALVKEHSSLLSQVCHADLINKVLAAQSGRTPESRASAASHGRQQLCSTKAGPAPPPFRPATLTCDVLGDAAPAQQLRQLIREVVAVVAKQRVRLCVQDNRAAMRRSFVFHARGSCCDCSVCNSACHMLHDKVAPATTRHLSLLCRRCRSSWPAQHSAGQRY